MGDMSAGYPYRVRRSQGVVGLPAPPTGAPAGCALVTPTPPQGGVMVGDVVGQTNERKPL